MELSMPRPQACTPLCAVCVVLLAETVSGQFMLGPDWLVSPVTTYEASSQAVRTTRLLRMPVRRGWASGGRALVGLQACRRRYLCCLWWGLAGVPTPA